MRPDPFSPYDVGSGAAPGVPSLDERLRAARLGEGARELAVEARRLERLTSTSALTGPCRGALVRCGLDLAAQLAALGVRVEALVAAGRAR